MGTKERRVNGREGGPGIELMVPADTIQGGAPLKYLSGAIIHCARALDPRQRRRWTPREKATERPDQHERRVSIRGEARRFRQRRKP